MSTTPAENGKRGFTFTEKLLDSFAPDSRSGVRGRNSRRGVTGADRFIEAFSEVSIPVPGGFLGSVSAKSGSMATVWGLSLGIFSLILSFGIGVGGAVGKVFAIVGGFFGFASVFFSVVGLLKSKSFYTVPSLVGNALGANGAALGVFYSTS